MEMKTPHVYSNDPRFVYNFVHIFTGNCYYSNHFDKIIRNGHFIQSSRSLNGPGMLINYNKGIKILIGDFKEDIPYGDYTTIDCIEPYYKITNKLYSCASVKKKLNKTEYTSMQIIVDDNKLIDVILDPVRIDKETPIMFKDLFT